MKKVLSIIMAIVLTAMTLAAFSSCGYNDVEKVKKNGKLVVYTEAGFAPYEFVYENKIVGVDIAIMQAVADELGVELAVTDVNFDTIIGAVQAGKADIGAAGITINEEREKNVDFSTPYSSTEQYVIVQADKDIPTVESLAGKQIGVQQGTTSDLLIEGLIKDGTMKDAVSSGYTTPALAAAAIGKIDAVVTDKLTAQNIATASKGALKTAKLLKADGSEAAEVEEYGMCVANGNSTLLEVINKVITKLLADGTIDAWTAEYTEKAALVGDSAG